MMAVFTYVQKSAAVDVHRKEIALFRDRFTGHNRIGGLFVRNWLHVSALVATICRRLLDFGKNFYPFFILESYKIQSITFCFLITTYERRLYLPAVITLLYWLNCLYIFLFHFFTLFILFAISHNQQTHIIGLMYIGPCIIVIIEE